MKTLIWSVAWGEYRYMLQSLVHSMNKVGIEHDILAYCDEPIHGCKNKELIKDITLEAYYAYLCLKPIEKFLERNR